MAFAQNLRFLMEADGLTNYQLSKEIGVHASSITNWLSGNTRPTLRMQRVLAGRFDLSVEELMGDELPTPGNKKPLFMEESKDICRNLISMYGAELEPLKGFLPADVYLQIKRYEYAFTEDVAAQIAEHLNISVDALLGKKNKPTDNGELMDAESVRIRALISAAPEWKRKAVLAILEAEDNPQ